MPFPKVGTIDLDPCKAVYADFDPMVDVSEHDDFTALGNDLDNYQKWTIFKDPSEFYEDNPLGNFSYDYTRDSEDIPGFGKLKDLFPAIADYLDPDSQVTLLSGARLEGRRVGIF